MKRVLFGIIIALLLFPQGSLVRADEIDDISSQLETLKRDLNASVNATTPLEKDVQKLQGRINAIKQKIASIETEVKQKEKDIENAEKALAFQKRVLDSRIGAYYRNVKKAEISLINLFVSENLSTSLRNFFYQKKAADNDKQMILRIVKHIRGIEDKKVDLQNENARLSKIKIQVNKQSDFLTGEIKKAKKYQSELTKKIAALTSRQKQLIAQKLASLNLPTSLGAGPLYCTDDRKLDPGFSPAFAFYTYGIPHRVGLNQYGALGRSKAGQNEEEILRAYFSNFELKKDYDTGINITVDSYGTYNIEDYVKRIYEMPGSWPLSALKAQAIAARSYALAYTGNGSKPICSTQSCQVFKPDEKGGQWNQAVEETRGWVMLSGGSPLTAWYASTAGGYTYTSGDVGWNNKPWTKRMQDGSSGYSNFSDLQNNAYDKESPCFYSAQGWRSEYAKSAWLKSEEVADIVNVLMLGKAAPDIQEHLSQTDKPNPDGTDTWDLNKIKDELRNRGINPYNSISGIGVSADFGFGKTTSISVSGDAGSKSFSGDEFKSFFNLRAPANIQIVGPLYNIEKR